MSPDSASKPNRKKKRALISGLGAVLIFVLAFVIFFHFNFTTVVVSGTSMLPTLKNGKKVLVSNAYWLVGSIRHGDIVVIKGDDAGEYMIKRVYKLGGEKVDVMNIPATWKLINGVYTVPDGSIYVLGDNRQVSEDSRRLGPVELSQIIGKVVAY